MFKKRLTKRGVRCLKHCNYGTMAGFVRDYKKLNNSSGIIITGCFLRVQTTRRRHHMRCRLGDVLKLLSS